MLTKARVLAPVAILLSTMAVGAGAATAQPVPAPAVRLYSLPDGAGLVQSVAANLGCRRVQRPMETSSAANWSDFDAFLFESPDCSGDPVATVESRDEVNLDSSPHVVSVLFVES